MGTLFKKVLLVLLAMPAAVFAADQTLLTAQRPTLTNSTDGVNYELGMKFSATVDGQIKAIRFYKSSSERGTHVGRIFSSSGQQLASVTFANESASGWQQQTLSSPLSIAANTQYTVSVNTAATYYVDTVNGFSSQIVSGDLRSVVGTGGVYGPVGSRPKNTYQASNYFRDIVFAPVQAAPPPAELRQSLFTSQKPTLIDSTDGVDYELGMKFSTAVDGQIKAIRFYKSSSERGTHVGRIFSSSGQQLAAVTFANESASGWQQQELSAPLAIAANTQYTVSVNTAGTYYVDTLNAFSSQIANGDLRGVAGNNGVYGPVGSNPTNSYQASNYFRDIVFVATDSQPSVPAPPVVENPPPPVVSPAPPPSIAGKPSAQNTGWQPTGGSLSPSGDITVTQNGTVIDGKDISGILIIQASNVTVKRCRVRTSFYYPIWIKSGDNITIEDTEVDGMGGSSKAIYVMGGSNVAIRRVNLHDSEDGINIGTNGGTTLRDSYIHDPRHAPEGHSDGIEVLGAAHITIQNNNVDYRNAVTSAMNFSNEGAIDDVVIDGNWLAGGAYMLYLDGKFSSQAISNVRVTNNIFMRNSSAYGTDLRRGPLVNITWTGNKFDDGASVP